MPVSNVSTNFVVVRVCNYALGLLHTFAKGKRLEENEQREMTVTDKSFIEHI